VARRIASGQDYRSALFGVLNPEPEPEVEVEQLPVAVAAEKETTSDDISF
jgi:hypothetical protein